MARDFSSSTFVFITGRTAPTTGRIERRLLRVMEALLAHGASVHLICVPGHPIAAQAKELGVEVAPYRLGGLNFFRTLSRVRKYLKRYRPVVVHSTGLAADLISRIAASGLKTAAVNSLACIAWPRTGANSVLKALRRYLDRATMDRVDLLVVDSESLVVPVTSLGVTSDCVLVDPPSIDLAELQQQAEQPWRPDFRPTGPLVGYGGRIEPSRGLEHLVAASAILNASGTTAEVVVAGDGPLLKRLREDAFSSSVRFLGHVPSVPAVLSQLEVAVFPSTGRGVPTALIEAAALGRPIVASRVSGIEELFTDGVEIRLVPAGDPRALASAIGELLAAPERARKMGELARLRTLDRYSSAASIDRHLEAYSRFMWD